jgi:hypothetical protein
MPPVVRSVNAVVAPGQTATIPVIANGSEFIVTVVRAAHPVTAEVNVITVVPLATPFTIPEGPIVATEELLLLHVPDPSLNEVVLPTHTVVTPPIVGGSGLTVTIVVALQLNPSE